MHQCHFAGLQQVKGLHSSMPMAHQRETSQAPSPPGAYFSPLGFGGPPLIATRPPPHHANPSSQASFQGTINRGNRFLSPNNMHFRSPFQSPLEDEVVFDSQPSYEAIDLNSGQSSSFSLALGDSSLSMSDGSRTHNSYPIDATPPTPQPPPPDSQAPPPKRCRGRPPSSTQGKEKPSVGRFHWDTRNTAILIEAKKQHDDRRFHAGAAEKTKTIEEQWEDIVALCAQKNFHVDWKIAYDKWRRLYQSFKDINDWDRNPPSGKSSYWAMTPKERAAEKNFSHNNFESEVYELMERCMGYDPVIDPPASVMDTSNVLGAKQQGSSSSMTNRSTSPGPPTSDAPDEQDVFDRTPTNGGVPRKARRRTHVMDVGLQEASQAMAKLMEAAENGKRARHEETLQVTSQFAIAVDGMSKAIMKMVEKM